MRRRCRSSNRVDTLIGSYWTCCPTTSSPSTQLWANAASKTLTKSCSIHWNKSPYCKRNRPIWWIQHPRSYHFKLLAVISTWTTSLTRWRTITIISNSTSNSTSRKYQLSRRILTFCTCAQIMTIFATHKAYRQVWRRRLIRKIARSENFNRWK